MTAQLKAAHLSALQIKGVTASALDGFVTTAYQTHGNQLRADAGSAGVRTRGHYAGHQTSVARSVDAVRAAVRHTVATEIRRQGMLNADSYTVPKHRETELVNAMCDGLGIAVEGSEIVHRRMRADSEYFSEQLTSRSRELIRPNDRAEIVRASLPVRNVEPYAEFVDLDFLSESGRAELLTPEQTTFNRVNYSVSRDKMRMHWFGVSTLFSWSDAVYQQAPSSVDKAAELARMARRALERLEEEVLIAGVPGIDFPSLSTAAIPRIASTVNFATATIGQKAAEMTRLLQRVRSSADFVGPAPSVGLIDPRLAFNLRATNNLDAGGNIVGDGPIMAAMANEGLASVLEAPTMARFFQSPRGSNFAQMLVYNPTDEGRIRQVRGLPPSPVSTANVHGTETLYAMKLGGIELGDVSPVAILDIQVA